MLICGVSVRRQGLEPRTRWLRVDSLMCQVVMSYVSKWYFATSASLDRVRKSQRLLGHVSSLGLISGSRVSDSVVWSASGWVVLMTTTMASEDAQEPWTLLSPVWVVTADHIDLFQSGCVMVRSIAGCSMDAGPRR